MPEATLLTQIILPIALASMMLVMGLSLKSTDFKSVFNAPATLFTGISLQLIVLPALAWLVIGLWQLPPSMAAGIIILALAPGGATSNIISFLSKGDSALSVSLTTITSLIIPFSLPFLLNLQFGWLAMDITQFNLPLLPSILQLLVVTVVPVLFGMALNHFQADLCFKILPLLQRLSTIGFILLVVALAWVNRELLPDVVSQVTGACLSLCLLAMISGGGIARLMGLSAPVQRTFSIELGIQNAGTAMMVAATLIGKPELAIVPLFYGILMNIPAFTLILFMQFIPQLGTVSPGRN